MTDSSTLAEGGKAPHYLALSSRADSPQVTPPSGFTVARTARLGSRHPRHSKEGHAHDASHGRRPGRRPGAGPARPLHRGADRGPHRDRAPGLRRRGHRLILSAERLRRAARHVPRALGSLQDEPRTARTRRGVAVRPHDLAGRRHDPRPGALRAAAPARPRRRPRPDRGDGARPARVDAPRVAHLRDRGLAQGHDEARPQARRRRGGAHPRARRATRDGRRLRRPRARHRHRTAPGPEASGRRGRSRAAARPAQGLPRHGRFARASQRRRRPARGARPPRRARHPARGHRPRHVG